MRHGVARVLADVEYQPVAATESLDLRRQSGELEHVSQDFSILGPDRGSILDMAPGNDEHVGRGDGVEVPEGDRVVAGRHAVRRDIARDDPAEDTVGHPNPNLLRDEEAARFLWDARNSEAARARAREHWIRQQARETATFEGILRALSERGGGIVVWTADGAEVAGRVVAISPEVVRIAGDRGDEIWVVRRELAGVSAQSEEFDAGVASDDRGPTATTTLAGLLAEMAAERAVVTLRCGGRDVSGTVAGAGADVITLRLPRGGLAYVPVAALTLLRLA